MIDPLSPDGVQPMEVKWLKPLNGFIAESLIGASRHAAREMQAMAEELGGTEDPVAIYVPEGAPDAGPGAIIGGEDYRACIAGLHFLAPIPQGRTVRDYRFDERWPVGVPIARSLQFPRPSVVLKSLMTNLFRRDDEWRMLYPSLQTGRPLRIAESEYAPLAEWLTQYVQDNRARFIER